MQVTETVSDGLKRQLKVIVPAGELKARAETKLEDLKSKVREQKKATKDSAKMDPVLRGMVKKLKRAQRNLRCNTERTLQARLAENQKILDVVEKKLSEISKTTKKDAGDPQIHSLRKKVKSRNRRVKKLNRLIKKQGTPAEA